MRLPRIQLFELEDLPWFPGTIRDMATDYLEFINSRLALHGPMMAPLCEALKQSRATGVVDLCSGAGGPVAAIYESLLARGEPIPFVLTDRFPNVAAFLRLASRYGPAISFSQAPIAATAPPATLVGLRTMFNAFHHFPPEAARTVLAHAVEARAPIAIFEISERTFATILLICFAPLMVAVATPFIRPFLWRRLLWTYLLPLVPLMCLWDGLVSQFRAYTSQEMVQLTRGLDEYKWHVNRVATRFGSLTYLWGVAANLDSVRRQA